MTPSNHNAPPSARVLAYEGLYQIFEKQAYANLTIQKLLRRYSLKEEERRFMTELIYGVCRRFNYLVWIIEQLSNRPVKKIHPTVRLLLCLGLYQLIFLDHVPPSAAVNETVKHAKKLTHEGNSRFINAILRNFLRKKEILLIPSRKENEIVFLSLTYNEPEWLVSRWIQEWGKEKTEALCQAMNEIPQLDIRCNTLRMAPDTLFVLLEENGLLPEQIPFIPEGIRLGKTPALSQAEWLRDGTAYVQNAASMVPARILMPHPGERVLDMCAAPGSKTTHMAQLMKDKGRIDAWDLYPHKIELIEDNCRRLGISCVHGAVRDATIPDVSLDGQYDKVLLDAPCSGLGVLQRKTELRWSRQEKDMGGFPPLQKKLLSCAARYVKPGGTLVYSTCTLNPDENERMVEAFLKDHPDYEPVPFQLEGSSLPRDYQVTLWPDTIHTDGFFAAQLKRRLP